MENNGLNSLTAGEAPKEGGFLCASDSFVDYDLLHIDSKDTNKIWGNWRQTAQEACHDKRVDSFVYRDSVLNYEHSEDCSGSQNGIYIFTLKSWLEGLPELSDSDVDTMRSDPDFVPLRDLQRYLDESTLGRNSRYVYFRGAETIGRVCAGQTLFYEVPHEDVVREPRWVRFCENNRSVMTITYTVPG